MAYHLAVNPDRPSPISRRGILKAAASALLVLVGCGRGQKKDPGTATIDLGDLPLNERVNITIENVPVELLRTDQGVRARSLICTHIGCTVKWSESEQRYLCPCHEGKFDAEGNVVTGPPTRPLRPVLVQVEGSVVTIRGQES